MNDSISTVPSVAVTYAQTGGSTNSNEFGMLAMQERICIDRRFCGETELPERLSELYTKMTAPNPAKQKLGAA